jgi:sortase B
MVEELPLEEPEENPASEEPIESELPAMIVEEVIPSEKPETLPLQTNEPVKPTTSAKPQNTKKPETKPTKTPTSENNDYVAWINIPGTVIDYPVVRSSRTEYYLHHMINGQESKLGCLFSLPTSDYQTPSKNIAIYGHHLSNSTAMFSTLMNYKREDYWRSHQTIQLDTIYGKRTYRIFAVINHTVSDWDASTASFKDDEAFLKFVNRAKRKAFYDTGIEVSESDHILTLITCDRSFGGVQGRLLVMGVEQ